MIGCVPDHVPGSAVNVLPAWAVPEIVGAEALLGTVETAATTAVCAEEAVLEPALFDAVTVTRIVDPTSADASVYDCDEAPVMSEQFAPAESQRPHW